MGKHGFHRTFSGRIVVTLEESERGVLAELLRQSIELVQPQDAADRDPLFDLVGIEPEARKPADPALARLLPDAYPDDPAASDEFRRYMERDLRRKKVEAATTAMQTLGRPGQKLTLSDAEAQAWLGALNDLRLVLGTRLGVNEDIDWQTVLDSGDESALHFHMYDWLTYLQDGLVGALMR